MTFVRIVGRWMLALGAAGAIGGCAIKGPPAAADIQREALADMTVPSAWKGTGGPVQPVADQWLVSFNDPVLSALVDEAVAHNADLRIAAIRRSHKTRAQQLGCSVRPCKRIAPAVDGVWTRTPIYVRELRCHG